MSKTNKNRSWAKKTRYKMLTTVHGRGGCEGGCRRGYPHVVLYLCCSFALGIQKIHFRKTILTWQDNDKQSDRATHQLEPPKGLGRRGLPSQGTPCTAHWLLDTSPPDHRTIELSNQPKQTQPTFGWVFRILIFITATSAYLPALEKNASWFVSHFRFCSIYIVFK